MSRTELKRLLLIAAAAFALRAGAAVVTERHPIFPPYYYQDAEYVDGLARATAEAWSRGAAYPLDCAPSRRLLVWGTAGLFRAFGPRPLAPKLANALFGALAVLGLGLAARRAVGPRAAAAAAAAVALWPSAVFYTSQNLKEAPTLAAAWLALAALLPDGDASDPTAGRLAAGVAALVGAGLLRSYTILIFSAALLATAAWTAARRPETRRACVRLAAAALLAPIAYKLTTRALSSVVASSPADAYHRSGDFVPNVVDRDSRPESLTTPEGLTRFRGARLDFDRIYAEKTAHREIATQIFPDARFESWLDVALFVPKGAFYAALMPLPGLYPMDGKVGRILASLENVALLALLLLAAAGAARGPLGGPRLALLLAFLGLAAVSGLFDFDLGSAGRHKLLYLPLVFPFAAEEALRLLGRKEPS